MQVSDSAGNAAVPARRLIRVACPVSSTPCTDPSSGKLTCTQGGVCNMGGGIASTSSAVSGAAALAIAAAKYPTITLVGSKVTVIPQGSSYDRSVQGGIMC